MSPKASPGQRCASMPTMAIAKSSLIITDSIIVTRSVSGHLQASVSHVPEAKCLRRLS
jgi:hypothetical protein